MQIGQMDEIHPFGHAIPLFLRAEDPAQVGRRQPFPDGSGKPDDVLVNG